MSTKLKPDGEFVFESPNLKSDCVKIPKILGSLDMPAEEEDITARLKSGETGCVTLDGKSYLVKLNECGQLVVQTGPNDFVLPDSLRRRSSAVRTRQIATEIRLAAAREAHTQAPIKAHNPNTPVGRHPDPEITNLQTQLAVLLKHGTNGVLTTEPGKDVLKIYLQTDTGSKRMIVTKEDPEDFFIGIDKTLSNLADEPPADNMGWGHFRGLYRIPAWKLTTFLAELDIVDWLKGDPLAPMECYVGICGGPARDSSACQIEEFEMKISKIEQKSQESSQTRKPKRI